MEKAAANSIGVSELERGMSHHCDRCCRLSV